MLATFTCICYGGTMEGLYAHLPVHPNAFMYVTLCRHNIFFWLKPTFQIERFKKNLKLFTRLFF